MWKDVKTQNMLMDKNGTGKARRSKCVECVRIRWRRAALRVDLLASLGVAQKMGLSPEYTLEGVPIIKFHSHFFWVTPVRGKERRFFVARSRTLAWPVWRSPTSAHSQPAAQWAWKLEDPRFVRKLKNQPKEAIHFVASP